VQKHRQNILFQKITRTRMVSLEAPASMTLIAARKHSLLLSQARARRWV
jgi:hypothetical protein